MNRSSLRETILKHLLIEKRLSTLKSQIYITFEVRSGRSGHTEDRQKERNVSRGDINLLLGMAVDEITNKIVLGELIHEDEFIVRSRSGNLFIPIILIEENPYNFVLMTKTVIRKERMGRPQLTIWVD
jgi:hypothetical protein